MRPDATDPPPRAGTALHRRAWRLHATVNNFSMMHGLALMNAARTCSAPVTLRASPNDRRSREGDAPDPRVAAA